MNRSVSIIDYGSNNLYSIAHALEVNGANVKFARIPEEIRQADRLVIPGVGAFPQGKQNLVDNGMFDELLAYAEKERPLFGICLGMQLLATRSFEFGNTTGLNLIPGQVEIIPDKDVDGGRLKRPHIGWAKIYPVQDTSCGSTIFTGVPIGSEFYMVHSFHVVPENKIHLLAVAKYGGHNITAAIQSGYVMGCQFHPEKSGEYGIQVLNQFIKL